MREMNISDWPRTTTNLKRAEVIKTSISRKMRPEEEVIMLMKTARNRFKKAVRTGKIEILDKYEWRLR